MSIYAQTILAFFTLLMLSVAAYLAARRLRLPHTVVLVLVGLLLVPLSRTDTFAYLNQFQLTPDTLFFIFLPTLIFESAYNMSLREMGENLRAISVLAIFSLLISAGFIAVVGHWALRLIGLEVPIGVLLLFGALISATDPVAVLALFKDFGAPKRLTLLFEGESLFNDATALALFLVALDAALKGFHGVGSLLEGTFIFVSMLVGGTLFGFFVGWMFARLLHYARHEHLQLTITLAAAHLTFLASELITRHVTLFGHPIHLSSILATVLASLVLGAHGPFKMSPSMQAFMARFWGYAAFVANSLVFILLGLMLSGVELRWDDLLLLTVIIVVVIAGRILSVYPVIRLFNSLRLEAPIPASWQKLLAWGSLRGALAVMMVLLIPDDYLPEGWQMERSAKDFIMVLTIGCIYFTLFIKATTMPRVLARFRIHEMQELEAMEYLEGKVYLYAQSLLELATLHDKPYVDPTALASLNAEYVRRYREAYGRFAAQAQGSHALFRRVLHIHALGIERRVLRGLFASGEISEEAYRRALERLTHRHQALERSKSRPRPAGKAIGHAIRRLGQRLGFALRPPQPIDEFLYHRALGIAAHEVAATFVRLTEREALHVFEVDTAVEALLADYREYAARAANRMQVMLTEDPGLAAQQVVFVQRELAKVQAQSLRELAEGQVIADRVEAVLQEEFRC